MHWIQYLTMKCACKVKRDIVMREMQENYYLVLFMFARQLYFYVLGPISLLGY